MNQKRLVLGNLDTNCYLVWADNGEGIVIDPADNAEELLNAIQEANITVTAVVLTHAHFDHMLAAEELCKATGAPLYVGKGDQAALSDPVRNLSQWVSPDSPIILNSDKTLSEGDTIAFGDEKLTVLETPGHTPGCICLYSDGVLFSGDTLFRNSIGRLDFPGGNPEAMLQSLQRLISLPGDTAVYSGHGPATTIECEIMRNPYLR